MLSCGDPMCQFRGLVRDPKGPEPLALKFGVSQDDPGSSFAQR
jgi:hypothetical protein